MIWRSLLLLGYFHHHIRIITKTGSCHFQFLGVSWNTCEHHLAVCLGDETHGTSSPPCECIQIGILLHFWVSGVMTHMVWWGGGGWETDYNMWDHQNVRHNLKRLKSVTWYHHAVQEIDNRNTSTTISKICMHMHYVVYLKIYLKSSHLHSFLATGMFKPVPASRHVSSTSSWGLQGLSCIWKCQDCRKVDLDVGFNIVDVVALPVKLEVKWKKPRPPQKKKTHGSLCPPL